MAPEQTRREEAMTYPPPGGENPQYQLQPEPQQPSDPYMQGYNSTPPPPANYYPQQPPPPQYTQPPSQPQYTQPPSQPMMPTQIGVQPGYPSAPGSVLPPPMPPAKQGGNLGVILAVIVGLVVVLGIAAVLIIPGMVNDDGGNQAGGDTSESEEPSKEEEASDPAPEPSEEEETTADTSGSLEGWTTAVNSDDYDVNTPEGAAIAYRIAADTDDDATMQSLVCANPSENMQFDLDWELENAGFNFDFLQWGISTEEGDEVKAWAGWTDDDLAPDSVDDLTNGYTFTAVQEDGRWKLCDVAY